MENLCVKFDANLWLLSVDEYNQLPNGTVLDCIDGKQYTKGKDYIDLDTRFGHTAFGVIDPNNHPEAELFTKLMLSK